MIGKSPNKMTTSLSNENVNGFIRQYLPKTESMGKLTQQQSNRQQTEQSI